LITGSACHSAAYFAAEVEHQRLQRGRGLELESHLVQFLLARNQVRTEAPEVFHEHQRMLLLLEEPDRHESREI
jgi:hypothetical protein